ncbi:MAG: hypothetical protein SFU91_00365 [Chloroherpetonaceae bacterium]|nr:hypothetical protein [Chloroherpetonaceae bacterium]
MISQNRIILLSFFLASSLLAQSQDFHSQDNIAYSKREELRRFRVGFSYSQFSAYGLNFSYFWNERLTSKVIFFGYRNTDSENQSLNNFSNSASLGFELQYSLIYQHQNRFYLFLGSGINYNDESRQLFSFSSMSNQAVYERFRRLNFGSGIGFELIAFDLLAINFETGLRYSPYSEFDQRNSPDFSSTSGRHVGFGFGGGLSFAF